MGALASATDSRPSPTRRPPRRWRPKLPLNAASDPDQQGHERNEDQAANEEACGKGRRRERNSADGAIDDHPKNGIADDERDADGEADQERGEQHVLIPSKEGRGDKQNEEREDLECRKRQPE